MTITPGHPTTGNASVIQLDESSFTLFPYIWKSLCLENSQVGLNLEFLVPTVTHKVRFCDGLGSSNVVQNSVGSIIILNGRITERQYVDWFSNQVHPMIQTLLPRQQCLHSHSWNCSVMVWKTWWWTPTTSLASKITIFEHHWTILVSSGD
jgi:hypothetical protein